MNKKVSIIIVNWNGERYLRVCLSSLLFQTYANREIIFVDNGSTDDSVRYVKERFPAVNVIELRENTGFTGGNAAGVKVANGEYLALVNNDTRVHERWLENLIQPMLADRNVGICASRILFEADGSFDSAGGGITTAAVGFNQGLNQGAEGFATPSRVFGACGRCALPAPDDRRDRFSGRGFFSVRRRRGLELSGAACGLEVRLRAERGRVSQGQCHFGSA
jgi:GT2 family glycosyltransferase